MTNLVDFPVKPEARDYLACFARDAAEPTWLGTRRQRGMTRFAELGWPTRRSEGWRYIDLTPIDQMRPARAVSGHAGQTATAAVEAVSLRAECWRAVLLDGHFVPELSVLPDLPGVWLGSTKAAIEQRPELVRRALEDRQLGDSEALDELNAAFFSDGFVLEVEPGLVIDRPIEIVHIAGDGGDRSLHTRSLIALGAGAHAAIFESYSGAGRFWRSDSVTALLGAGAQLDRFVLVEEPQDAVHLDQSVASLGPTARLATFVLLLGGRTARHEANVTLAGDGAQCEIDGLFIVGGRDEANIVTTVDHAALGGQTRELVKGVAAERGHGAFQGRMIVREHAQKTDAHQLSRNLIIGPRAVIDTKPELEIYADDVKCSHGATVGDLDEASLFYLRARGIPDAEARRMLIEGFLREAVEGVENAALREHLLRRLAARLSNLEG